jgi:hypothetical protein
VLRELDRERESSGEAFVEGGLASVSAGAGRSDVILVRVGSLCLKTSVRRRFDDTDTARAALLRHARMKSMFGALVPHRVALCLHADEEGGVWLWSIGPWVMTLRHLMMSAVERDDEPALTEALAYFAEAAIEALLVNVCEGVVLDVHPSNFGRDGGRSVYLDDDASLGGKNPAIGHALLRRVDEYARFPVAVGRYVELLLRLLPERFTPAQVRTLDLVRGLREAFVSTEPALAARRRLVDVLEARLVEH